MSTYNWIVIALFTLAGLVHGLVMVSTHPKNRSKADVIGIWLVEKTPCRWVLRSTDGREWTADINEVEGQRLVTMPPIMGRMVYGPTEAGVREMMKQPWPSDGGTP